MANLGTTVCCTLLVLLLTAHLLDAKPSQAGYKATLKQRAKRDEGGSTPECTIKWTEEQRRFLQARASGEVETVGQQDLVSRWPNDIVPYEISSSFTTAERNLIDQAILTWQTATCLTFTQSSSGHRIRFIPSGGCWSYVGYIQQAPQDIGLNQPGCIFIGVILHEIGHALGLWHEQSRPDRDDYVMVHLSNVIAQFQNNFDKFQWSQVITHGLPYDYESVMHYGKYDFAVDPALPTITTTNPPGTPIGQRTHLSDDDIKIVRLMYQCPANTPVPACTAAGDSCTTSCSHQNQKPRTCHGMTGHICCNASPSGCDECISDTDNTCTGYIDSTDTSCSGGTPLCCEPDACRRRGGQCMDATCNGNSQYRALTNRRGCSDTCCRPKNVIKDQRCENRGGTCMATCPAGMFTDGRSSGLCTSGFCCYGVSGPSLTCTCIAESVDGQCATGFIDAAGGGQCGAGTLCCDTTTPGSNCRSRGGLCKASCDATEIQTNNPYGCPASTRCCRPNNQNKSVRCTNRGGSCSSNCGPFGKFTDSRAVNQNGNSKLCSPGSLNCCYQ